MDPKRICLFIPSMGGGGAERAFALIANGLAETGAHVQLVLSRAEGPCLALLSSSVELVDLRQRSALTSVPGLVRHLRRVQPDAVVSAMIHANLACVLAHALSRSRARLILSEHAHLSSVFKEYAGLPMNVARRLMRWAYPRADAVVCVSRGVLTDLQRHAALGPHQGHVIYNPVVDATIAAKAAQPASHPWFADAGTPVVLAVGRLTPQKDYPTLLQAFAMLSRSRRVRLLILGEGEERAALSALVRQLAIEECVDMPGFAPNPYAAMQRAKLVVLSSAYEGMSYVLVEAMACGTAVVSTDCPSGPAELLEDGRWGRLVPVGDAPALAHAMGLALDDPDPPSPRIRAEAFTVDAAVAQWAELLGLKPAPVGSSSRSVG